MKGLILLDNTAYCLYRVSTTKQVDKTKDDIPMQREACREFAKQMGWSIGKEFLEKGVSGFKVSAANRDAIQELKTAALNNEFQILLVFMFDRIGRIDDETPFIVEWFVKHGIRVWSVQEGEQRFESHVDKLMNYIRFWQASGESEKTSLRIKTRIRQLKAEGRYTGGIVPFGYQLVNKGHVNKKGREICDLAVNPIEAEWVVRIFDKTVKEGYGSYRLAKFLNENGVRTHNNTMFKCNNVIRILRNKTVCGYIACGEDKYVYVDELKIVDKDLFEKAQYVLEQRARANNDERQIAMTTKSQALVSGIAFCAHCGGRLSSSMHTEKYTTKTGEMKTKQYLRYICYHRTRHLCECDGQSVYSADKIDKAIMKVVTDAFSKIKDTPNEQELRKDYSYEMEKCRARHTKLNTELHKLNNQYDKLNEEIANTLIGESTFSQEQLSKALESVQQKRNAVGCQIEKLENEMMIRKRALERVRPMYEQFKGWSEEFMLASTEQKKMIISQLISRIEIGKGYKIRIKMNMAYEQFWKEE